MPQPIRISAVVPAYNAARTIAETLEAILAQTTAPSDIVVVDDGSRDDTRGALQPYADRATLVFQENGGVSAARNRGVAEAKGEWLAFCDADDLWHPDKLTVVAAAIAAAPEADLIFHDFWTIEGDVVGERRSTHSARTTFPIFKEVDISLPRILPERRVVRSTSRDFGEVDAWQGRPLKWLMVGNFLMPSTVVIRRAAFDACGGFDAQFRYAEDTEFFLRFAKRATFCWLDASLTGYRRAPGTLLTGNMMPTILNGTRAVVKHCIDDAEVLRQDPRWVKRAVARRLSRLAYYCVTELQPADARTHALSALRYNPLDRRAWGVLALSLLPAAALARARRAKSALQARGA